MKYLLMKKQIQMLNRFENGGKLLTTNVLSSSDCYSQVLFEKRQSGRNHVRRSLNSVTEQVLIFSSNFTVNYLGSDTDALAISARSNVLRRKFFGLRELKSINL
jgi:hypothetical protein